MKFDAEMLMGASLKQLLIKPIKGKWGCRLRENPTSKSKQDYA